MEDVHKTVGCSPPSAGLSENWASRPEKLSALREKAPKEVTQRIPVRIEKGVCLALEQVMALLQSHHLAIDLEALGDELPSVSEKALLVEMRQVSSIFVSKTVL